MVDRGERGRLDGARRARRRRSARARWWRCARRRSRRRATGRRSSTASATHPGRGDDREERPRPQVVACGSPCRSRRGGARRRDRRRRFVDPPRLDGDGHDRHPEVARRGDAVLRPTARCRRPSRTSRGADGSTRRRRAIARTASPGGTRPRSGRGRPRRSASGTARRAGRSAGPSTPTTRTMTATGRAGRAVRRVPIAGARCGRAGSGRRRAGRGTSPGSPSSSKLARGVQVGRADRRRRWPLRRRRRAETAADVGATGGGSTIAMLIAGAAAGAAAGDRRQRLVVATGSGSSANPSPSLDRRGRELVLEPLARAGPQLDERPDERGGVHQREQGDPERRADRRPRAPASPRPIGLSG